MEEKLKEGEGYSPFKSRRAYEAALAQWKNEAKEENERNFGDFKDQIFNAVSAIFADFSMRKGCRYDQDDLMEALDAFFEDPDPFDFADLIDNSESAKDYIDFYESEKRKEDSLKEKNNHIIPPISAAEKRMREREQYYKDMKKLFH